LKISTERQPESQILLNIEVEPERVEKSIDQAYRRIVGKYRIPGFRPGKAPRVMFERYVGRETLLREALEKLVPQVYDEAVKEESIDAIDQPQFEIPTVEPLLIKATVPVRPTVYLGGYREIRQPREEATVTAEQVDEALDRLRKGYATLEPVDRAVQEGDIVVATLLAEVEGSEILNEESVDLNVTEELLQGLPGLHERLLGVEKGGEYDFEVAVSDDFDEPTLAGHTVKYHVHVHEVKEEILPALDDAFAVEVGEGYETLAALRERVESDMLARRQEQAERDYEQQVIGTLINQAQLEFPPVLVQREIDHIINEQAGALGRNGYDAILRRGGAGAEALRDIARPIALDRVQRSLVLTRLAELEGVSVDDAEVDAEVERVAPETPENQQMREIFSTPNGRELLSRTLLTKKVYERLREIAEGKEVPPQAVTEEPPAEALPPKAELPALAEGGTESEAVQANAEGAAPADGAAAMESTAPAAGATTLESTAPGQVAVASDARTENPETETPPR